MKEDVLKLIQRCCLASAKLATKTMTTAEHEVELLMAVNEFLNKHDKPTFPSWLISCLGAVVGALITVAILR